LSIANIFPNKTIIFELLNEQIHFRAAGFKIVKMNLIMLKNGDPFAHPSTTASAVLILFSSRHGFPSSTTRVMYETAIEADMFSRHGPYILLFCFWIFFLK
jgi:hypothetical protein